MKMWPQKAKAAAILHIQFRCCIHLDAGDDSGITCYLTEKQNILQLRKKIINSFCCNSEQNANIAAKKTVLAIQEDFSSLQATWPAQFAVYRVL